MRYGIAPSSLLDLWQTCSLRSVHWINQRFLILSKILNLVVDLARTQTRDEPPRGIEIAPPGPADERTLAWIDETFGGTWSSEAFAGSTIVARRSDAPVGFATIAPQGLRFAWLSGIACERDVGIFGPFGVAPAERKTGLGELLLRRSLGAMHERGYARALIPAVSRGRLAQYYEDCTGAAIAERFDLDALLRPQRRTLVLASGNGSNFQAVADAARSGELSLDIVALFSNNLHALALARARDAGLPSHVISWNRGDETREQYDQRLLEAAAAERPDLVLLLGWMHLLPEPFVRAFPELLNLHPAFLPLDPSRDDVVMPDGTKIPAFRGPRAVRDALAGSCGWVGATLHRVTAETDRGPVIARKPLRVEREEEEAHLMERVHDVERSVVRAGLLRWLYER